MRHLNSECSGTTNFESTSVVLLARITGIGNVQSRLASINRLPPPSNNLVELPNPFISNLIIVARASQFYLLAKRRRYSLGEKSEDSAGLFWLSEAGVLEHCVGRHGAFTSLYADRHSPVERMSD